MYDYLIVGAGLFGCVFAERVKNRGEKVLILEKRPHVAGNIYTYEKEKIQVHAYGPHLFHTNNKTIWEYVNKFAKFNNYQHKVKANYKSKIYSLPFNLTTYNQLWGVTTPQDAIEKINREKIPIENPSNLEEWALSKLGPEIYHTFIYGYTTKQWKKNPKELPSAIIKRLPLRFTYNDNYYNDTFQGVPYDGYTHMIENMIDGVDIKTNTDFFEIKDWKKIAKNLVYTGPIDRLFNYEYGQLEYLTLKFDHKVVDGDFQGCGQVNYTEEAVPHTRIVEHKHFCFKKNDKSIVTHEYPRNGMFPKSLIIQSMTKRTTLYIKNTKKN